MTSDTHGRRGRKRGIDYGAQLLAFIDEYPFLDQEMAAQVIRGTPKMHDPTVEYHMQKLVKQGRLTRHPRRLYGRTVYYTNRQRAPLVAHQYRVAKLTYPLVSHPPSGKLIAPAAIQSVEGIKPDIVLRFYGAGETTIFLEYQTHGEAWTTPKKIDAYQRWSRNGLKLFVVERSDAFLLSMAERAASGDFCFAHPDAVLASSTPWEAPLFYFGGSGPDKLALVKGGQ